MDLEYGIRLIIYGLICLGYECIEGYNGKEDGKGRWN